VATDCIAQLTLESEEFSKPIVARFDTPHSSSDGGAVLVKAVDSRLGLTRRLAACLEDARESGKVLHEGIDLLRQRVYGLCCGYADCNDAARLTQDPVHKLILGRDPLDGLGLASQPTLSRFENAVGRRELYAMGHVLANTVIEVHRQRLAGRARRITIDLDPTDDPTHGQQEFAFFNGHYDTACYLPVVATLTFNDEPAQYAVAAVLRPGTAPASRGARALVWRLVQKLRTAFPTARLRVRLDGGFAHPKLFAFFERLGLEYVVAMASNVRLEKRAQRLLGRARLLTKATGETAHVFGETRYAARSWTRKRRVIIKAEVVRHPGRDPKTNPRFVVTNLPYQPARVYAIYCARGDVENRLKELHDGLEFDRTSCSRFWPNQLRMLLTLTAYILLQELRHRASGTGCATAQVSTLRERLIKLAVRVERSVRRIVLHLPRHFPWRGEWIVIAQAISARA